MQRRLRVCSLYFTIAYLLWADRPASGPGRIAHSFEIHLEEADRLLARRDAVPDFFPRAILHHGRVADGHRPRRDLPDIAVSRGRKHEIAGVALRVGMQRVRV